MVDSKVTSIFSSSLFPRPAEPKDSHLKDIDRDADQRTSLSSSTVTLVPYCQHHVTTYHDWMKDPDIQAATASEPLSLEDEYLMQKSWRNDHDKLTFIICLKHTSQSATSDYSAEIASMIGDVNMFITYHQEADDSTSVVGELELMIATKQFQRRGYGKAALLCFLAYIKQYEEIIVKQFVDQKDQLSTHRHFDYLAAKIGESNERSLRLFESLGFTKTSPAPNYFGEFELRLHDLTTDKVTSYMTKHGIHDFSESEYEAPTNVERTSLDGT